VDTDRKEIKDFIDTIINDMKEYGFETVTVDIDEYDACIDIWVNDNTLVIDVIIKYITEYKPKLYSLGNEDDAYCMYLQLR
jgi:chitinase